MIITSCSLAWASYGQCQYQIYAVIQGPECGVLGFPPTFGTALSDNGEVVGWYTACTIGTDEAFYWSEKTGFVFGGFTGREAALNNRDPINNVTILSGDLAGDDDHDDPFDAR